MKTSILRVVFLSVFLLIASTFLMVEMALSNPLVSSSQFIAQTPPSASVETTPETSETETQETKTPPTPESTTEETSATEKASEATNKASESSGPYDMDAMRDFNRALYGS